MSNSAVDLTYSVTQEGLTQHTDSTLSKVSTPSHHSEIQDPYSSSSSEVLQINQLPSDVLQINQICTHLPDHVIELDHNLPLPHRSIFQGVLLFADISGFTALSEKYSINTKNGSNHLTKTLNGYLGVLVEQIIQGDGDILKFAGDAILAVWKVKNFLQLQAAVVRVINCAMDIQNKCGEWVTDVGVILKVKIGISSGEVNVAYMGDDAFRHYVTIGQAVGDVNQAEKFCSSGDVVLSPSTWSFCCDLGIEREVCEDGKHVKILEIPPGMTSNYSVCRTVHPAEIEGTSTVFEEYGTGPHGRTQADSKMNVGKPGRKKKDSIPSGEATEMNETTEVYRLRKTVLNNYSDWVTEKLRLYIAKPVLRKLDDHQPIEYLSEMRQVTILFLNMTLENVTKGDKLELLQTAMIISCNYCKEFSGCVNKVFMFDKGCTFLILFGLPGFKQDNDCALALQCAYRMKKELDEVQKVTQTSIGVTTGSTFCGVVGHKHRHEYTVIGRKVNMAARLMMHYPDRVTCDNETFHHSKLPKANFTVQETKEMKGLKNVGLIREYTEVNKGRGAGLALAVQEFEYPILGRSKELDVFMKEVRHIKSNPELASARRVIIFDGETGIGKTRMLDAVIVKLMEGKNRVISCGLSMHESKSPYLVVKSLLMELLEINFDQTHQERERILLNKFDDNFILSNLCLLNDLLYLKLPPNPKHQHTDTKRRQKQLHQLLFWIVHCMSEKFQFIVFAIDDAHYMDTESWEFIADLGQDKRSLVVLTVKKKTDSASTLCDTANRVLNHPDTIHVPLEGLSSEFITPLCCQLLDVIQIPKSLALLLKDKSHGVPSWCDQLLREMYYDGAILIVSEDHKRKQGAENLANELTAPMDLFRRPGVIATEDKENQEKREERKQMICVVAEGRSLSEGIPDSIRGMIQARIDRMEEADQMVLKCSAILGMSFSRKMLEAILPQQQQRIEARYKIAVKRLLEGGVLVCASATKETDKAVNTKTLEGDHRNLQEQVKCYCPQAHRYKTWDEQLMNCQYLCFQSSSMQETAYAMFVDTARRQLHKQAAQYLEAGAHKCQACGGGEFDPTLHKSTRPAGEGVLPSSSSLKKQSPRLFGMSKADKTFRTERRSSTFKRDSFDQKGNFSPEDSRTRQVSSYLVAMKTYVMGGNSPSTFRMDEAMEEEMDLEKRFGSMGVKLLKEDVEGSSHMELDMRNCECIEILANVYPQLVRNWRAAGNVEKTVFFLTEAAAAAIATCDNLQALSYLKEVVRITKCIKNKKNPFEGEVQTLENSDFELSEEEKARIERLMGQAMHQMGQMDDALPHFNRALKLLGNRQPTTLFGVLKKIFVEGVKQWLRVRARTAVVGGNLDLFETNRLLEQARCLAHLFHEYLDDHQHLRVLLTSLQQVNRAEDAEDLHEITVAYSCMMECCQLMNWPDLVELYENRAQNRCFDALQHGNPDDLLTLAHLYCIILNTRLASGRILAAQESGFFASRITEQLHENDLKIRLLPLLAEVLLLSSNVIQCAEVLQQLSYAASETDDRIGQAWYYGCCLDLMLEAGCQLEKIENCKDFAEAALEDHAFQTDKLPLFYLAASLALWNSRKNLWKRVNFWQEKAMEFMPNKINCYLSTHGLAKLVECHLMELSMSYSKAFMYRVEKAQGLLNQVTMEFESFKNACKHVKVHKPRLHHLKAYFCLIRNQSSPAKGHIKECLAYCRTMGNILEQDWVTHSQQVWFDSAASNVQDNYWLEHDNELIDWHAASQIDGSIIKYSLPLPSWYDYH